MGTDIHSMWQKKTEKGWEDIENPYKERRHYQLFAVLAGVRNGYGCAGCPTGEAVEPISEPRGLPDDFDVYGGMHPINSIEFVPEEDREWYEDRLEVWMGDHSYSWLTADEMLEWYENAPTVIQMGIIEREQYEIWDKKSSPESYCGGISGPNVLLINDDLGDMKEHINWTHIRIKWKQNLNEELQYFFDIVKSQKEKYGEVRFVFGFDS